MVLSRKKKMGRTSMKRTAFKRAAISSKKSDAGNPISAKNIDVIGQVAIKKEPAMRRAAVLITRAFVPAPKPPAPVRNETYRRAVASLPCVMCGMPGYSQAAHGSAGKGMGLKACDMTLFPACCDRPGMRGCHSKLDQGALFTKAVRHEIEPVWAADTQRRVHAMGLWPKNLPLLSAGVQGGSDASV